MQVTVAKSAGFCFGVKRAVEEVYRQLENAETNGPVYTYGPIIHNEQVVSALEKRGVRVVNSPDELYALPKGTVVIRSHGVSRQVQQELEDSGMRVVDATCPFVKKIHRLALQAGQDGQYFLIAGNPDHPEVQGIIGWTSGPAKVIKNPEDLEKFDPPAGQKVLLAAQTTFNRSKFEDIVAIFRKKRYDGSVMNTVCSATDERQTEARLIAGQVDAMIVIGGRHSSNSQKLYEICRRECRNTYFIETLVDLDIHPFQSFSHVGITAGASTPKSIIEEVIEYVRNEL